MSLLAVDLRGLVDGFTATAVRLASATPEPAERVVTPPEELITPGTLGFLVTFAVAVAFVLLVRDMVRRNRRLALRAERRDARLRATTAEEQLVDEHVVDEHGGTTRPAGPLTPGDGPDRGREGPVAPKG